MSGEVEARRDEIRCHDGCVYTFVDGLLHLAVDGSGKEIRAGDIGKTMGEVFGNEQ